MKFGELRTGEETVTPNWVYDVLNDLTLASDMKVLALLARQRLYRNNTFKTWEIAGKTGLDVRTVQASTRRLGEAGHIVSADGEHCLRGACAKAAQPLHKSTRTKPRPEPRQDEKKPTPEVKEVKEEMEQEEQERGRARARTQGTEHSLSREGGEERAGSVGAPGAEAPGGAGTGAALTVSGSTQVAASDGTPDATSVEEVPPGAAGGGEPPDPTRIALEIAFGPVFLAQLLGEGPLRPGWLGLSAGRVAELHQEALDRSGDKPWKTLLISQLDIEVAKKRARGSNLRLSKRREDLTPEEWLS